MNTNTGFLRRSRRAFLKMLGLAGGAAAALAVKAGMGVADEVQPGEATDQNAHSTGYHVTEHIRNYYDKARF